MRCTLPNKSPRGFTLVEILLIAPIVILAIGGFVAVMVTMVGDVLVTRDQSSLSYNTQSALDRIEQDTRLSTQFLVTTGTLTAPQGSNSNFTGTAAFTNTTNTLVLSALATDKNPMSASRWLVYYANQPNACGADQQFNRVLLTKVIYYINSGSLWRRTVVPDWNTNATADANTVCASVWQQNSCSPGYSAARCKTNDEKILDNVDSMTVKYYTSADSTTDLGAAGALGANTIDVTLNTTKTTAGDTITDNSNVRVSKLNDIDTTQVPPNVPVLSNSQATPNSIAFTWQAVTGATAYMIGYRINGGTWVTQTVNSGTNQLTVTANRRDTIDFRVASFNNAGSSAYATSSATIASWFDFQLYNGWGPFSTSYNTPGFTKTSNGRVFLRGLVKDGTTTSGTVIAKLPEGYRPSGALVFQVVTNPNVGGRVDVLANGDVIVFAGSATWLALDNISFLPSTQPYTWNNAAYVAANNWSDWGSPYEPLRMTLDTVGRVNMQGLSRAGTQTSNTIIANPPSSAYNPPKTLHFPAGGNGFAHFWVWWNGGNIAKRGAQTSSYLGLNALYYPGTVGTWTSITPISPWLNFNDASGTYPMLACTKSADDVVTLRGLIKSGSVTGGTVMAKLPAACPAPDKQTVFATPSNELMGRFDVMANGDIVLRVGDNTWMALNASYVVN